MNRNALLTVACLLICSQCAGQDPDSTQTRNLEHDVSVTVVPSGMRRQVPARWSILAVNGTNRTEQATEELVAVSLGDQTNLQFARRFWIPAQSRRQAWLPVLVPDLNATSQKQLALKSIHLHESNGREGFRANAVGEPTSQRNLLLSSELSRAAVMFQGPADDDEDYELIEHLVDEVQQFRDRFVHSDQDLGLIQYVAHTLPASPQALDSIDHLVIGGERFRNDSVACQRIMDWVRKGGRLWIMVEQVSEEAIHELLGTEVCFASEERVELNAFTIKAFGEVTGGGSASSDWASDEPVTMSRVFTEDVEVACHIEGWPVAFWKQLGEGEILFTTLGSRGLHTATELLPIVRPVLGRFFTPRLEAAPNPAEKMRTLMDREIGYSVPSRGLIGVVLGGQCLIVLFSGIWLARKKQLHYFAALIPIVSVVTAGFLLASGLRNSTATESTVASGQFVRVSVNGTRASVGSSTAIYSQDGDSIDLNGSAETTMFLDQKEAASDLKRIVWTDDGRSKWDGLKQPPGVVRHCTSTSAVTLPQRTAAMGRFTPRGFEATIDGIDPGICEDVLVVSDSMPALAMVPETSGEGIVLVGEPKSVMLRGQFTNQSLVGDRLRNRQEILRNLLTPKSELFGSTPTLLAWTPPLESGLTVDERFQKKGTALVSIPIQYQRSDVGTQFVVPANFVRLDTSVGERGVSMIYNSTTGQWLESLTKGSSIALDCKLPKSLMPCDLNRVNLQVKVSAPSRTLTLESLDSNGEYSEIYRQANPQGLVELVVDRSELLRVNESGGWRLKVTVSKTEAEKRSGGNSPLLINEKTTRQPQVKRATDPSKQVAWQIEFVRVSVAGTRR